MPTHSFPSIYLQTVGENHETGPNIFICADGVQMAQCASEEGGHILATLLSIYYVYNIPYPKHLRHSLHFIQLALCGRKLTKDEKIPVPVSNMLEFVLQQVIGEDDLLSKDDQGDLSAS